MALLCLIGGQIGHPGAGLLQLAWPGSDAAAFALPAGPFILLFAATWLGALLALLLFPRWLPWRQAGAAIFGVALLCRLLLLPHPASDDVNRYLWEGRALAAGLSPYSHAPQAADDPSADGLREGTIWAGINHPEMTAIYPPLSLAGFALVASAAYSPLAIKLVMLIADLATLALLLLLLRERRLPARWALLYALNPVILYAYAGQGHLDAWQGFLLVALLWCHDRRRWAGMYFLAGLAFQAKYVAILIWPFLLRRENWRWAWLAPAVGGLPLLVFWLGDGPGIWRSLFAFGLDFSFNGPIHMLLQPLLGGPSPAAWACLALLGALLAWRYLQHFRGPDQGDLRANSFFVLGAFLLLSPTVHFWYLSWILPFLVLRPHASWILLSGTIAFSFVAVGTLHHTGSWVFPGAAGLAVWALPLLMMVQELDLHRRRGSASWPAPRGVSVVIPALNEEAGIRACVRAARNDPVVGEVIVVDGGSQDCTVAVARAAGAQVIVHQAPIAEGGGRGGQIVAGCQQAREDLIVLLHADTLLPAGSLTRLSALLRRNPGVVGGALGAEFAARGWRYRLLEIANDLRAVLLGICFGDQVQFFRREPLVSAGLVPPIPLMEDVELSLRLRLLGRTSFLWGRAAVSARRWEHDAGRKSMLVVRLVLEYLIKRFWGRADAVAMYARYYADGENQRPPDC